MKMIHSKFLLGSVVLFSVFSCKKTETTENVGYAAKSEIAVDSTSASNEISSVASMAVKDRLFIKTANVDMEVKDVYDVTISIEKSVQDLGGFVTNSNLRSTSVKENTYNTSDSEAMIVKKFQTENTMQVRVPTEKLAEFLQQINDKKIFLNSRIINAEDISAEIKLAEMEAKRIRKTGANITTLKTNKDKVTMSDENRSEENIHQYSSINFADNLKYSTVNIFIKEPKLRIAEIPVINAKNIDNKYKYNFWYDAKNAFIEGYYLIQMLLVGLIKIWPLILIGALVFYFLRKRKNTSKKASTPS